MIKDVMVRLDGSSGDDAHLAAATQIGQIFEAHITGLFFNVVPDAFNSVGSSQGAKSPNPASKDADAAGIILFQRLTRLQQPTNPRRFDVPGELKIFQDRLAGGADRRYLRRASAERSRMRGSSPRIMN